MMKVPEAYIKNRYTDDEIWLLWDMIHSMPSEGRDTLYANQGINGEKLASILYNNGWHLYPEMDLDPESRHMFFLIFSESLELMPTKINDENGEIRIVAKWRLQIGK